ncbi:MAG: pantoate--beta-alanine ligase [SAR202 cluster bacterium Io17-Chloro-G9]|nr:MAG: pantoate--beta-alanine ligase [SAR202 cluster bacterium Io17-Chloro-G9]
MRIVKSKLELVQACREAARPLGLVPTMGALHEGHVTLVRQAREENQTLAVTIFVNPAQFSPQEDLAQYPRDLDRDLGLLREEGTDLVFVPPVEEIYPPGFDTWVQAGDLASRLEGAQRSGHFRGVTTVLTKLFNMVSPDRAYFGQKDGQQTVVVRQLARDLDMGLEIVVVPTVRESDGLALSSRNVYLTPEERRAAPVIYRALCRAQELRTQGVDDGGRLRQAVENVLAAEPLVERIDYVSVAGAENLEELAVVSGPAMVSVAVRIGRTRLIDNVILE